jgi:erythromycin esterase-like protein
MTFAITGLGEPTHGSDALLEARNEIFRGLVEREGYRAIAIESDCLMGLVVDDYVTAGKGTLDEAMRRGFSHGFGASAANRELVRWLRAYNEDRPAVERVRFAGLDGPLEITHAASPREALTALHGCMSDLTPCTAEELDELIGDDTRWAEPAAMMDPSRSVGRTPEAQRLRLIADDMAAQPLESERARLYARTATGLLRYHYWLADTSPDRMAWLLGIRASMMAANLRAIADERKVMAFAHNGHLQREKSSVRLGDRRYEWWSAGARLGGDYTFLSMAIGTFREHGVAAPPPDTIEGLLYARPGDRHQVDPAELGTEFTPRVSPWFGYAPLDPAHLGSIDRIVFVKDA